MNKDKLEKVESLLKEIKNSVSGGEETDDKRFFDRRKYLSAFEETCNRFDVEVELEEDVSKDKVYEEWSNHVNMTASELQKWSKNPCSRQASVNPVTVMKRNLRLLEKDKSEWTSEDVQDAQRTISFISRMSSEEMRPENPREGPHGCPSEWAISLLNWAYNPFSSVPSPSSEVKNDLEAVEKVTLEEIEGGYEFEPVPDRVLYSERDDAATRAKNLGLDGVHEQVVVLDGEQVTMYMPGDTHRDWKERVHGLPDQELSQSRKATEVVHGNEQERAGGDDDSVQVSPVAIHKVDGGTSVKVEDDVDSVLDRLWDE